MKVKGGGGGAIVTITKIIMSNKDCLYILNFDIHALVTPLPDFNFICKSLWPCTVD